MRADTLSLKDLFHKDVRYVVPTFQRSYVWKQDEQWEPLWEDVRNAAERYLDEVDRIGGDPATARARAITHVGRHFMGAIVVQQQLTGAAELETRDVIDGQQRLTTLQLLADAAQQVTEEDGFAAEARSGTPCAVATSQRSSAPHGSPRHTRSSGCRSGSGSSLVGRRKNRHGAYTGWRPRCSRCCSWS
ncbi:MAG: DUF262 domain-containing protein [Pseudonocardia sp.]|nr:DUF262 domain-containing protein [Pseudonocardia sp.]